jgi:sigma-54 specific flagellar transcriptional regulator A
MFPYSTVDFEDLPEKYRLIEGDLPEAVTKVIEQTPAPEIHLKAKPDVQSEPQASKAEPEELPEDGLDLKQHLANLEYLLIKQALEESDGVVAHAAKKLKMQRTTLVEKMKKYGIQREGE